MRGRVWRDDGAVVQAEAPADAGGRDDEAADTEIAEAPDLLFLAIETVGARRKEKAVAELVGPLLCGVRDKREERAAEIAENKSERRGTGLVIRWAKRDEGAASNPAVQQSLADEPGECLVDRHHRDAIAHGHLAVRLQLGADRHLAGCDLSANIESDLLVERHYQLDIMPQCFQSLGKRAGNVSQPSCFGESRGADLALVIAIAIAPKTRRRKLISSSLPRSRLAGTRKRGGAPPGTKWSAPPRRIEKRREKRGSERGTGFALPARWRFL